jgi:serine/threonine-protein kinase
MAADSLLGQSLDEYRLVAALGRGGMARVYRGLDQRLQRPAAIKVIDTQYRADPEYVARFEREARTIAQLDNPHIVRLYRYGNVDGLLYMAMQYVPGADLEYVLNSYRADGALIEPADALRLAREVGQALDYAHAQGVIHRDVKPSNILLDRQGRAILTDFGLALLADLGTQGRILGSPHYVAPEQALSSAQAVPQSDLYSVGVILYEMFTGRVPFHGADPMDVALMQIQEAPPPPRSLRPDLNPAVEAVILKALAKDPAQRHTSGAALSAALEAALASTPGVTAASTISRLSIPDRVALQMARDPAAGVPMPPPTAAEAPAPWLGPRPTLRRPPAALRAGLGVVVALSLLVACGLLTLWLGSRAFGLLAPSGTARPTAGATGLPVALPTARPTPTAVPPSPTTVPPSPTPAPSTPTALPPVPVPELLLVKAGGDMLVVINRGAAALPLAPLTLGDGRDAVEGAEWELAELPSGACVAVGGEDRDVSLPEGVRCDLMGAQVERSGRDRFWRNTFEVFYDGERIGRCDKKEQLCAAAAGP